MKKLIMLSFFVVLSSITIGQSCPAITGPSSVCISTTKTYTYSVPANLSPYQWSLPGWATVVGGSTTSSTVTIKCTSGSGNYTFQCTTSGGTYCKVVNVTGGC